VMAVFHGLGGAYRLNTALGLPNPIRAANRDAPAQHGGLANTA
jgi:hypothetical protein